jgi:metal-responsive CopG/Arc/MetJ family transcriptional regulator
MDQFKPILVNLPIGLLEKLDGAASEFTLNRSEMLRKCLTRDLAFVYEVEISRLREARQRASVDYQYFRSATDNCSCLSQADFCKE